MGGSFGGEVMKGNESLGGGGLRKKEEVAGTRDTPIEVVAEVVATREVPKPVEVKQKPGTEEATARTLPKRGDKIATAMGSGPLVLRRTREW